MAPVREQAKMDERRVECWWLLLLCVLAVLRSVTAAGSAEPADPAAGERGWSTAQAINNTSVGNTTRPPSAAQWWRGHISVVLTPRGDINVTEGEGREFHCRIINRPLTAQIRWFYAKRTHHRGGYTNYTILANEYLTVNPEKFHSTYVEPATYILTVRHFSTTDSGEYTCFLQTSPSETHRDAVHVSVMEKPAPEAVAVAVPPSLRPAAVAKPTAAADRIGHVEFSTRQSTIQPRPTGPLRTRPTPIVALPTQSTQLSYAQQTVTHPPLQAHIKQTAATVSTRVGKAGMPASTVRSLLTGITPAATRKESTRPPGKVEPLLSTTPSVSSAPQSSSTSSATVSGSRCDYHIVVHEVDKSACPSLASATYPHHFYYAPPKTAAASADDSHRYRADNVQGDYMEEARPRPQQVKQQGDTGGTGGSFPSFALSQRIDKLEDRLIGEMVKQQLANHTMTQYESGLRHAESLLVEQARNVTRLEEALRRAEATVERQRAAMRSIDEKLAGLMLDVAETNSRLDKATRRGTSAAPRNGGRLAGGNAVEDKHVAVSSASEANGGTVEHFKDCDEVYRSGRQASDVYYIKPLHSARAIPVWCDMDTWPGGWLVIQRRNDGTQAFNQNWSTYRHGFGNVSGEFWLGNDNIFLLTNQAEYMLRIDMWDFFDSRVYAEYRTFKVDGERDQYKLTVGNHSGTARDGLQKHDGVKFSTPDRDNDLWQDYHCALDWSAGWWFTNCWHALLNGAYNKDARPRYKGMCWIDWKDEQLKATEMKIRPVFHFAPTAATVNPATTTATVPALT